MVKHTGHQRGQDVLVVFCTFLCGHEWCEEFGAFFLS